MKGKTLTNARTESRPLDFYPTPPDVTEVLISFLKKSGMYSKVYKCWEPACGTGEMSAVLEKYFDVHSTDISKGVDYLRTGPSGCDILITNPPFNLSEQFIRKAASEDYIVFAMLLKSQYWHAKKRLKLFHKIKPDFILPLTWRPDFYNGERGGSPTMEVCWNIWTKYHRRENTIYLPIGRDF